MSLVEKISEMPAKVRRIPLLCWISVIIPTVLAILYYGIFASDVFISESRFVVRSPDKPAVNGLGLLMKTTGISNSGDEMYPTIDYLKSRDALSAINKNGAFEKAYSETGISVFDRFNSFGTDRDFESLFKYYTRRVKVEFDSSSSITTLTVRAYGAADARRFNEQLLEMAEDTVNRMSERGRRDLMNVAQLEVEEAEANVQRTSIALSEYRNQAGLIDPEKQAAVQMQMISKLQDELIATRTQLLELRTLASASPQIPVLESRESGLTHEIDEQMGQVAGNKGSLAASAVKYTRLSLDSQFADKQLASALASLEEARSEARRKRAYVERVVQPNLPDYPLEPRRLRNVFSVFVLGMLAWGVLSMLFAGMLEHRD